MTEDDPHFGLFSTSSVYLKKFLGMISNLVGIYQKIICVEYKIEYKSHDIPV